MVASIVKYIDIKKNDCVLEIGPGKGALTKKMLEYEKELKIVGIEVDHELVDYLKNEISGKNFKIVPADVLKTDLEKILLNFFKNHQHWKIVGNLPYNISSPILFKLINLKYKVCKQILMLQKEVVERMIASPGNKTYGRLSVMLQSVYSIDKLMNIEPDSFSPAPKVMSALVRMVPNIDRYKKINNWNCFSILVARSFASRRKTIKNNLHEIVEDLNFNNLNASPKSRAEEISVDDFIELSNQINIKKFKKS